MGVATKYNFTDGWQPSTDALNAPDNALLRSDNVVMDEQGIVALRLGSSKVNSSALATTDIRSVHAVDISGTRYRLAQGTGSLYAAAGTGSYASIASGFDSTLDAQFTSYLGQLFIASGTVKKKYDGTTVRNWGIAAPTEVPRAAFAVQNAKVLASGDSGETTWTDDESSGAGSYVAGFDGTANGARSLTASASTFRGVMSRDIGSSTDYTVINSIAGSADDLVEFYAKIDEPEKINSITVTVDFNASAAATFNTDYATYTWSLTEIQKAFRDDIQRQADLSAEEQLRNSYTVEGYSTLEAISHAVSRMSVVESTIKPELAGWHYFSARRGDFKHVKTNENRFWDTVRGVRISFQGTGQATLAIDRLRIVGGAASRLNGTYVYRALYVRESTSYNTLGVTSSASAEVILRGQGATVSVLNSTDSQVTHIWLYRMGGFLDAFYRVARVAVTSYPVGDYTASFDDDYFSELGVQFTFTQAWEESYQPETSLQAFGPSNHTVSWEEDEWAEYVGYTSVTDALSDAEALILNIRLETDNALPPDGIIGISEDYYNRIFCLASDGILYPSRRLNPESFSAGQNLKVGGATESFYWIKKSFGGLYVGTSKDIYRVSGTGSEYPDGTVDFKIQSLNINSPPVDASLAYDGNVLIYRAQDGPRLFQGETSTPLRGQTDLLWRGYNRHGVQAINGVTGRFRMAITDGVLSILTPEGTATTSTTAIYRYNFAQQQWYRHTYGQSWRSIYREPDGTLVAGDTAGFVWVLDDATATGDAGTGIAVELWTRADDFGMPFKPKRSESILMRLDTGGVAASMGIHLNGASGSILTAAPTSSDLGLYSYNLAQKKYYSLQWRLTGSFTTFRLYGYTIQFVEAPESVEVYDSGPISFATSGWVFVRSIRLKAQTSVALTVTPYLDGEAQSTKTITPFASEAVVYDVNFGREMKATQPRFVITAPTGSTFEPYWLECSYRAVGNMSEKKTVRVAA